MNKKVEESDPRADTDKPIGYWLIKALAILAIAALAGFSLTTDQNVSPIVYTALAVLAGGPEVAQAAEWLKGGRS